MKRWYHVKLQDCVSILGDGLHGTPAYSPYGEYAFINGNNLSSGHIAIKEDTKRVSVDEYRVYGCTHQKQNNIDTCQQNKRKLDAILSELRKELRNIMSGGKTDE